MSPLLVRYERFLDIAAGIRWDADAVDLGADARAWRELDPTVRDRVAAFVAAFRIAEERVALDLEPFIAAAADQGLADCFRAQARDEERHARFFERYAGEVVGTDRLDRVDQAFVALFEERLRAAAEALAGGRLPLPDAVALYHLVLEGAVFNAGQNALLADMPDELPGLREGVQRVVADERWHIGLGVRVLRAGERPTLPIGGEREIEAWGRLVSPEQREATLRLHRRRLRAAGVQGPSSTGPSPPSTPFATATS